MGLKSRNKGKSGERELARELRRVLGVDAYRAQQYKGAAGDSDVLGLPGVHVESKRTEKFNLYEALKQATDEALEGNVPAVFHRRNHQPWVVIVRLDDLPALVNTLYPLVPGT